MNKDINKLRKLKIDVLYLPKTKDIYPNGYNLKIKINRNSSFRCDRSLNSSKFQEETKIQIPSWKTMIDNLYKDIQIHNDPQTL